MHLASDKDKLARHFQKNAALFAYHLGDLDDFFFSSCRWPVIENDNGEIEEAILIYDHPQYPTVMAFGLTDRFGSLLEETIDMLPDKFFCHFHKQVGRIFRRKFEEKSLGLHFKMKLDPERFKTYMTDHHLPEKNNIIRLDTSHTDSLIEFYKTAYPDGYFDPRMLETGKFFGAFDHDNLAVVAGIHVYSNEFNVGVLGSVATEPKYRGKGLATTASARLTEELVAEGKLVALHVAADNHPAMACYKKIGFAIAHEYEEALYTRR